jgi:hypothetical protein
VKTPARQKPATSLAHLLEKHYYKIARHPGCGKFTIDITNIVYWIKEAGYTQPKALAALSILKDAWIQALSWVIIGKGSLPLL